MTENINNLAIEDEAEESTEKVVKNPKEARKRIGKTKRDHESGAWRQRQANLIDRAAWINETRGKPPGAAIPPMPKPHGLGNSSKRFKIKPGRKSKV